MSLNGFRSEQAHIPPVTTQAIHVCCSLPSVKGRRSDGASNEARVRESGWVPYPGPC